MITFYSTHCPKCTILEKKLKEKNIQYVENNDAQTMLSLGFTQVPILDVDGVIYDFNGAIKWIQTM